MTIGDQESGQARCRMKWQVGDVEMNVLSAGKVTDTGLYRIILDSEGSFLIHKPSGSQVKFKEKGYTFTLKASDIKAVATIAPVDAEMLPIGRCRSGALDDLGGGAGGRREPTGRRPRLASLVRGRSHEKQAETSAGTDLRYEGPALGQTAAVRGLR